MWKLKNKINKSQIDFIYWLHYFITIIYYYTNKYDNNKLKNIFKRVIRVYVLCTSKSAEKFKYHDKILRRFSPPSGPSISITTIIRPPFSILGGSSISIRTSH